MKPYLIAKTLSFGIDKTVGYACITFGMVMTISTLIGILFRYVMVNPLPWTEELARYTMIWMGLLAISMGVKRESHLGLNLFVNLLPAFLQTALKMFSRILIGIFLYVLMVYGSTMAMNGIHQTMPALQIPMSYVLIAVPLSAVLSLVQLVLITVIDVTQKGE
ncbi:TRAP transporter small permease [Desulfobacula sp.]|uniref:TRAP transporter small permease n=1 Tax=Desulfobacula sp. TaxID=2593537 RepID=UPI00260F375B|nr:TRAP transporter small permease [Desulfobacula sp.]